MAAPLRPAPGGPQEAAVEPSSSASSVPANLELRPARTGSSAVVPVRTRAPATLGSIFAQQKDAYDRRMKAMSAGSKRPASSSDSSASRLVKRNNTSRDGLWPEGLLDTATAADDGAAVSMNDWHDYDDFGAWGDYSLPDFNSSAHDTGLPSGPLHFSNAITDVSMDDVHEYAAAIGCFYHLSILALSEAPSISCDCSPGAVEIAQMLHGRLHWLSILAQDTSQSAAAPGMHKRCIVNCLGASKWECNAPSCRRGLHGPDGCIHRRKALEYVRELHGPQALDDADLSTEDDLVALQKDPSLLLQHQPLPALLALEEHCRCYACGSKGRPAGIEIERRAARVFHALGVERREIEVARCACRHRGEQRTIGPDLGQWGLFNFNNETIVAHAVLNKYSSQMLRSSTPLTAFQASTTDCYLEHGCEEPFLPKTTFLRIFFFFISLQKLESSFTCPTCGPHPEIVIADGVVLAHNLRDGSTLVPPTVPGNQSDPVPKPGRVKPFLQARPARSALRAVADQLASPSTSIAAIMANCSLLKELLELERSAASTPASVRLTSAIRVLLEDRRNHQMLENGRLYCASFSGSFRRKKCLPSLAAIGDPNSVPGSPSFALHASQLALSAPVLGNLAIYLVGRSERLSDSAAVWKSVRALWRAIHDCVQDFVTSLRPRAPLPPNEPLEAPKEDHGNLYGAQQLRKRPQYPNLKEARKTVTQHDSGADVSTCNKFYSDYVKPRRTGGIMALWCRHANAVGFHCMPSAEGRDDVFSALLTHWPIPPRVVVYDFACQLASYAIAREPGFFADTLFVVDELHQHGHSQCTPSSWLSTYMANDPALRHLNSSAAECGNAGLSRIKKSVAYSTAPHAIALTRHFLSLWNRRKINELLA
ncbi:hypothetical protein V8E36_002415 [Tilletia maclaganii]